MSLCETMIVGRCGPSGAMLFLTTGEVMFSVVCVNMFTEGGARGQVRDPPTKSAEGRGTNDRGRYCPVMSIEGCILINCIQLCKALKSVRGVLHFGQARLVNCNQIPGNIADQN